MKIFVWKWSKIAAQKKVYFFTFFGLLLFLVFFNGLFAPTSGGRMSNIFRDSESLRKSNGKKWSNIWTFLFGSGLKSPRIFFFFAEFALVHPPMASVLLSASVKRCFVGIFCNREVPQATNAWVQFRAITSFKLLHGKGFYSANVPEVTQKLAL